MEIIKKNKYWNIIKQCIYVYALIINYIVRKQFTGKTNGLRIKIDVKCFSKTKVN
jgi:hypothetical protein